MKIILFILVLLIANMSLALAQSPFTLGEEKTGDISYQREMGFTDDPSLMAPQLGDQSKQNRRVQLEQYLAEGQGEMENLWDDPIELEHFQNQVP